jgi:hypothetical protein
MNLDDDSCTYILIHGSHVTMTRVNGAQNALAVCFK